MANIAQIANVLQSMILTDGDKMVLTPSYYVFKMYKVHQDAKHLPLELTCDTVSVRDNRQVPLVSATASQDSTGKVHISMSNIDLKNNQTVSINLADLKMKKATGEILTAKSITDYNSFEEPNKVIVVPFKDMKLNKGVLTVKLPAQSIVGIELE